jgi:hypothetical protein
MRKGRSPGQPHDRSTPARDHAKKKTHQMRGLLVLSGKCLRWLNETLSRNFRLWPSHPNTDIYFFHIWRLPMLDCFPASVTKEWIPVNNCRFRNVWIGNEL